MTTSKKSPKYAPANDEGLKPYVVEVRDWGRLSERLGWGTTSAEARWSAMGRPTVGVTVRSVRRATPADMERLA